MQVKRTLGLVIIGSILVLAGLANAAQIHQWDFSDNTNVDSISGTSLGL